MEALHALRLTPSACEQRLRLFQPPEGVVVVDWILLCPLLGVLFSFHSS